MATTTAKDTQTAIVIVTNERIEVYQNHNNREYWINRADCMTQYKFSELRFVVYK